MQFISIEHYIFLKLADPMSLQSSVQNSRHVEQQHKSLYMQTITIFKS